MQQPRLDCCSRQQTADEYPRRPRLAEGWYPLESCRSPAAAQPLFAFDNTRIQPFLQTGLPRRRSLCSSRIRIVPAASQNVENEQSST